VRIEQPSRSLGLTRDLIPLVDEFSAFLQGRVAAVSLATTAIENRELLVAYDRGTPAGFIVFTTSVIPDTGERVLIERMIFVRRDYRGSKTAESLVNHCMDIGAKLGCTSMIAGASIGSKQHARALYERMGFETNFTFKKEITHV